MMTYKVEFTLDEVIDGLGRVADGEKIITAVPIAQEALKAIGRLRGQLTGQTALAARRLVEMEELKDTIEKASEIIQDLCVAAGFDFDGGAGVYRFTESDKNDSLIGHINKWLGLTE